MEAEASDMQPASASFFPASCDPKTDSPKNIHPLFCEMPRQSSSPESDHPRKRDRISKGDCISPDIPAINSNSLRKKNGIAVYYHRYADQFGYSLMLYFASVEALIQLLTLTVK